MSESEGRVVNHILYLDGDISNDAANNFLETLNEMEREYGAPDLILKINSKGGSWDACKTICCTIEQYSGEIIGMATKNCSSAAFIILQKCDLRYAYENTAIVIHEVSMAGIPEHRMTATFLNQMRLGKNPKIQDAIGEIVGDLRGYNSRIANFFSERSGMDIKEVRKIMKDEDCSDPAYLLENNFLDYVISCF